MIYILHGEHSVASRTRLQIILDLFKNYTKVHFSEKSSKLDYLLELQSQDLINNQKIIICENFFKSKKINISDLKIDFPENNIIFLENAKLTQSVLKNVPKKVIIEEFKLPAKIFQLLDLISPRSATFISKLYDLGEEDIQALIWHLSNRIILMIFSKLGFGDKQVSSIVSKPLFNWQWQKIEKQAKSFDLAVLNRLLNGLLKIDYLKKSGKSDLSVELLVSTLFRKYTG